MSMGFAALCHTLQDGERAALLEKLTLR